MGAQNTIQFQNDLRIHTESERARECAHMQTHPNIVAHIFVYVLYILHQTKREREREKNTKGERNKHIFVAGQIKFM